MDPQIFVLKGDYGSDESFRGVLTANKGLRERVQMADFAINYESTNGIIHTIVFHKCRYPISLMSEDHWRMIGRMIQECEKEADRAL